MDDIIEISEIPMNTNLKSSNFGGGLELLMNDKVKDTTGSTSLGDDLDDISKLEFELNELTNVPSTASSSSSSSSSSSAFSTSNTNKNTKSFNNITLTSVDSRSNTPTINVNSTLGDSTSDSSYADNKTWDGFSKLNSQINPDKVYSSPENSMSKEELMREKFKILKKYN